MRTYSARYTVQDSLVHRASAFTLSALPNYTEFTALFDSYRITRIDGNFVFDANSGNVLATATHLLSFLPNLLLVNDYDDAVALGAVTDYEQYETFKVRRLDRPVKVSFVPMLAVGAYGGAVFTNYARAKGVWLDAASPGVEHYGLKFAVDSAMEGGAGTQYIGTLSIYWTFHIECADTR